MSYSLLILFFPVEGNSLRRQKAAFQGWRLKQQREAVSRKPASLLAQKWSPTGEARGTSIEIPSYANPLRQGYGGQEASEGYPPVAKSTEASSHEHMNNLLPLTHLSTGKVPWSSA